MVYNPEEDSNSENMNLSYKELLEEIRQKAKAVASKAIPELYNKLVKEGKKPREAKIILEHDLSDIWSKVTINTYLPDETKNEERVETGKLGQTLKKKKELMMSTEGQILDDDKLAKEIKAKQDANQEIKPDPASFSESPKQDRNPKLELEMIGKQQQEEFQTKLEEYEMRHERDEKRIKELVDDQIRLRDLVLKAQNQEKSTTTRQEFIRYKAGKEACGFIMDVINLKIPTAKVKDIVIDIETKKVGFDSE